ncbi:MAG TPA: hypothetical protein VMM58_06750 [Bacteroidota bacterium]|nr:hypothetical protein [Bacteroidota bacterium]
MISESTKAILAGTVKEWNKFKTEQIKLSLVANDIASIASRVILEQLQFLKAQGTEVQCETVDAMKILNVPITVQPIIEAVFPNSKASVLLKCAGAARTIVINPNLSISAGGNPIMYDQLQRNVPESFAANAAEFVRDAFLNVARGGKENPAA